MLMTMTVHPSPMLSAKAVALRQDMRKLWEDHITWTRLAIISLESGTPDTDATVARLLRNQTDIGDAVKPYYGEAAGNELTRALRAHILIAADVIAAGKAGDSAKLADAQARWIENADQIAALLHSVNPRYWPLDEMKAEMHMHLELTTQEAVARLQGDWTPMSPPTTRCTSTSCTCRTSSPRASSSSSRRASTNRQTTRPSPGANLGADAFPLAGGKDRACGVTK